MEENTTRGIAPNPHQNQASKFNLISNLEKIQEMELSANCARECNGRIQTLGNCMGKTLCYIPQKFIRPREGDSLGDNEGTYLNVDLI